MYAVLEGRIYDPEEGDYIAVPVEAEISVSDNTGDEYATYADGQYSINEVFILDDQIREKFPTWEEVRDMARQYMEKEKLPYR